MTLSEARRLTGLTQKALADAAGITVYDVSDLERGKNQNPSHELVMHIVAALRRQGLAGLTAEDLFPVSDGSSKAVAS
jgi:transcriptional regulator with XRE-family HTH domain